MIEYRSVIGEAVELPSFTSSLQRQRIATAWIDSPDSQCLCLKQLGPNDVHCHR